MSEKLTDKVIAEKVIISVEGEPTHKTVEPHATESHSSTSSDVGMPQLDFSSYPSQIFWLAVIFAAFYVIMARSVIPRIHNVMENRQNRISHDLDLAEKLTRESEIARVAYETELAKSKSESAKILTDTQKFIAKNATDKSAILDKDINSKLNDATAKIAKQKEEAIDNIKPVINDITAMIVEKTSSTKANKTEIKKAVEAAFSTI